jgi:hypothetical protein
MNGRILLLSALLFLSGFTMQDKQHTYPETYVKFITTDSTLQKLYDRAEKAVKDNIVYYDGRKTLIEGAQYRSLWLETQPMGGYMYAKRNLEIAKNNIEIFMDYQRADGRLPGVIYNRDGKSDPNYCQFQGLYFPMPAYEIYYLLGKDKVFLQKVYNVLEKFDDYLWKTRDSDSNGCLETWCIYDNGEDNNVRFNGFPKAWAYDFPPTKGFASKLTKEELKRFCKENKYDSTIEMTVPIESMDVMSYSYSCRDVLSLISKELNTGKEAYWRAGADKVKNKMKEYLWDAEKKACYDRDKNNKTMPILLHNNLRCMYFGSFDQDMADKFIKFHLLNSKEFWTPMPLPSIAVNDPMFRNISENNWSGQSQCLTFQRSIQAMENYGHFAELTMIGQIFLKVISDSLKFSQQFDPFTTIVANMKDGYGPAILSSWEFISRLYGIHISLDKILWSCIDSQNEYDYTQKWNNNVFRLKTKKDIVNCYINDQLIFSFSKGARIVTDLNGKIIEIIGIGVEPKMIKYNFNFKSDSVLVEPNSFYRFKNNDVIFKYKSVEFSKLGKK